MKKKVFVVDDESLIATLIETAMAEDYEINHIATGKGCLDRLTRERPDLMFVDMHMPEMDGLEVVAKMRRSPQLADIPVVIMSANTSEFERNLVLAQNIQGYVAKPLNYNDLHKVVGQISKPAPRF